MNEAVLNIATLLQSIQVWPAGGATVEWGSSLMNLVMNDLRSCMNIAILDASMRIIYVNEITDDAVDKIIGIWKKHGNRQIELWSHLWKKSGAVFINILHGFMCI